MKNNWVSFSPHIKGKKTINAMYLFMIVALVPALVGSVFINGYAQAISVAVSVLTAFLCDVMFNLIKNKKFEVSEISSIYVGLLIGMSMPTASSVWQAIVGTALVIILIKGCTGGVSDNLVSEVAVAKILMFIMFGSAYYRFRDVSTGDMTDTALIDRVIEGTKRSVDYADVVLGQQNGAIGETMIGALLLAGVVLCIMKIIDFRVPLAFLVSSFLVACLLFDSSTAVLIMLSSGVVFCAFFVATEYSQVPSNKWLRYAYGLALGIITAFIWKYGTYQIAPYYAVLICGLVLNAFKWTMQPKYVEEEKKA